MLLGLIGKLHEIYAMDKFKVYLCTIPTPAPLARPPAPSQGDLAGCTLLGQVWCPPCEHHT